MVTGSHSNAPLDGLSISLVGPGRVGGSLVLWAAASGARIATVAGSTSRRAGDLAARLGAEPVPVPALSSRQEDLLLLAVADGAYSSVAEVLARRPQAPVALLVSGSEPLSALAPLTAAGTEVGVLHPLRAFPEVLAALAAAHGLFFALGGAPRAVEMGARLAAAWEGQAAVLAEEHRLLYHFAATLAAGGVGSLLASAAALAKRLRLPSPVWKGYVELARGALEQVGEADRPEAVLTGPAARGDWPLVRRQLAAVEALDPTLARLARALAEQTATLRGIESSLDEES